MQSTKKIRFLGFLLVLIGLFLVGLVGTIVYNLAPGLLQPGLPSESGTRFTGTAEQGRTMLLLFAAVIGFGLTSIVNGLWQIVTGRRNKWIMIATLGVTVLVIVSFLAARQAFPGR